MKNFTTCLLLICSIFIYKLNGQNAYYDAQTLSKNLNLQNHFGPKQFTVLYKYYPGETDAQIAADLLSNPFLKQYFDPNTRDDASGFLSSGGIISSIGGLDVTNFADGLAQFLVERGKEELDVAFFEKFKDFMNNNKDLAALFPNTVILINNFNTWEYSNILNTLKEAFNKDLQSLPDDFINIKTVKIDSTDASGKLVKSKYGASLTKDVYDRINAEQTFLNSNNGRLVLSALAVSTGIRNGNLMPAIIDKLDETDYLGGSATMDVKSSIDFLNIISKSIQSQTPGKAYVSAKEFENLMSNNTTRNLYLGLIYQQVKNKGLEIGGNSIAEAMKNGDAVGNYIGAIVKDGENLDVAVNNLIDGKKKAEKDLSPYWTTIFQFAGVFLKDATNSGTIDSKIQMPAEIKKYVKYTGEAFSVGHDIAVKNYNAAIISFSVLLSDADDAGTMKPFLQNFVKYYSFAANVVSAQSPDEVKKAIESMALPAGSYSIKRETARNICINGFIGPFYGREYTPALLKQNQWANSVGIAAPIGVAFSLGNLKCNQKDNKEGGKSISIFISLIDIGALASYRLDNDSASITSQIKLQNIVSPGAFIQYGFGKCPLSFEVGAQVGPELRQINAKNADLNQNYYIRLSASLLVDIPFFNIASTSRKQE